MPLIGAIADRTGRKRDLMLGTGWFGALACVAMVFVHGADRQLGAALYALAFVGYSRSSWSANRCSSTCADRPNAIACRRWTVRSRTSGGRC